MNQLLKPAKHLWVCLCLSAQMLAPFSASAAPTPAPAPDLKKATKVFTYDGQNGENFTLVRERLETRYRDVQVQGTCTREVPYETEECGNVTRYRQECSEQPGHEECYNVDDQECTSTTRYRQECHDEPSRTECSPGRDRQVCEDGPGREVCRPGPSRRICKPGSSERVCHTEPGRMQCRTVNGEERCREIPGREVCDNKPGAEICYDEPGAPICHSERGERICRMERGDDVCVTKPGQRICRDVPYNDEQCRNVTRRQCDWVGPGQQCEDIPYEVRECNTVTRTRSENYACTRTEQVPYQVVVGGLKANIEVQFKDSKKSKAEITFVLTEKGEIDVKAKDLSDTKTLILAKRKLQTSGEGSNQMIDAVFMIEFVAAPKLVEALQKPISTPQVTKDEFRFKMGKLPADVANGPTIKLNIKHNDKVIVDKAFAAKDYKTEAVSEQEMMVIIDLRPFKIKTTGIVDLIVYKMELGLDLKGKVINDPVVNIGQTVEDDVFLF